MFQHCIVLHWFMLLGNACTQCAWLICVIKSSAVPTLSTALLFVSIHLEKGEKSFRGSFYCFFTTQQKVMQMQ